MDASENPFTPSFGEVPAHLAGRKHILDNLVRAFNSARRRPELTTIISGARGTGKTTLLTLLANKAEEQGWIAVSTTALPGMLDDIEIRVRKHAAHLIGPGSGPSLAGVGIPQVIDVRFEKPEPIGNWRSRMETLLDQLEAHGTGLLITVDEVNVDLDEMVQLAAVYQHFVREERKVALLMAGLPHHISALLNDKTVSFLRRAQTAQLGRIADFEIEDALLKTIREHGRNASPDGLRLATKAIGGFPFLMQLVGYRSWDANPQDQLISSDDFEFGIELARNELQERILEATFRELSPEDVRFASAMLEDGKESRIADLVVRLDRSSAQVSQYRKRLIDAGIIGQRGRGVVAFELPYFREFLAEKRENGELD